MGVDDDDDVVVEILSNFVLSTRLTLTHLYLTYLFRVVYSSDFDSDSHRRGKEEKYMLEKK